MSNYKMIEPMQGAPSPASATATVQQWPLGYEAKFVDIQSGTANVGAGVFVYAQGSNCTAIGQAVALNGNQAVLLAAANSASKFPVGVAAGNLSATNVYGWVQVQGVADYVRGTNSAIAAGAPLYINAGTAGLIGSNVVAGNMVLGAVCPVSYTSSQSASMTVQLNRPIVVGLSASL